MLLILGHEEILAHSELLTMAQGGLRKAIAFFEQLCKIPDALQQALTRVPISLRHALELAREITIPYLLKLSYGYVDIYNIITGTKRTIYIFFNSLTKLTNI